MGSLSVYGAAKRAVRYVAHALTHEAKESGVLVGTLYPGLMITDFTMSRIDQRDAERWESTKRIFNIIADRPETVALGSTSGYGRGVGTVSSFFMVLSH
jgi:short-subunit dehydrogenase